MNICESSTFLLPSLLPDCQDGNDISMPSAFLLKVDSFKIMSQDNLFLLKRTSASYFIDSGREKTQ